MMIKRLCSVFILMFLFAVNYGCATNLVVDQKVPSEYVNQSNIKHFDFAYYPGIIMNVRLRSLLALKFNSKITKINSKKTNKTIDLSILFYKVTIADRGATLMAGVFVGNNSLYGKVIV